MESKIKTEKIEPVDQDDIDKASIDISGFTIILLDDVKQETIGRVLKSETIDITDDTKSEPKSLVCDTEPRATLDVKKEANTNSCKSKRFQCPECHKILTRKRYLKNHLKVHEARRLKLKELNYNSVTNTYICKLCDKIYKNETSLKLHIKIHAGKNAFQCSKCYKKFTNIIIFKNHVRNHATEKARRVLYFNKLTNTYDCKLCNTTFKQESSFSIHMKHNHKKTIFQYSESSKMLTDVVDLTDGKDYHTTGELQIGELEINKDTKTYNCKICYKEYKSRYSLMYHMRYHTGKNLLQCSECCNTYSKKWTFQRHMRTHANKKIKISRKKDSIWVYFNKIEQLENKTNTKAECKKCGKIMQGMVQRLKVHHNICGTVDLNEPASDIIDNDTSTNEKNVRRGPYFNKLTNTYDCKRCNTTYKQESLFSLHMNYHEKPVFQYFKGSEMFTHVDHLKTDRKETHVTSESKANELEINKEKNKYKCKICFKEYKYRHSLMYHMRYHTGQKLLQCSKCYNKFANNWSFKRHMKTHVNNKKKIDITKKKITYDCNQCDKKYKNKYSLKIHLESHREKKLFQCLKCDENFKLESSLKTHMITVHPTETLKEEPNIETSEETNKVINTYDCKECDKKYTREHHLKVHMNFHRGKKENALETNKEAKTFSCKICYKEYKHRHSLTHHMRYHTEKNLLQCSKCYKRYSSNWSLKRHMKTHANNKIKTKVKIPFQKDLKDEKINIVRTRNEKLDNNVSTSIIKNVVTNRLKLLYGDATYRQTTETSLELQYLRLCGCYKCNRQSKKENTTAHIRKAESYTVEINQITGKIIHKCLKCSYVCGHESTMLQHGSYCRHKATSFSNSENATRTIDVDSTTEPKSIKMMNTDLVHRSKNSPQTLLAEDLVSETNEPTSTSKIEVTNRLKLLHRDATSTETTKTPTKEYFIEKSHNRENCLNCSYFCRSESTMWKHYTTCCEQKETSFSNSKNATRTIDVDSTTEPKSIKNLNTDLVNRSKNSPQTLLAEDLVSETNEPTSTNKIVVPNRLKLLHGNTTSRQTTKIPVKEYFIKKSHEKPCEFIYVCCKCGRECKQRYNIQRHCKVHAREAGKFTVTINQKTMLLTYKCLNCSYFCGREPTMWTHCTTLCKHKDKSATKPGNTASNIHKDSIDTLGIIKENVNAEKIDKHQTITRIQEHVISDKNELYIEAPISSAMPYNNCFGDVICKEEIILPDEII